jgi:hypothetical protein
MPSSVRKPTIKWHLYLILIPVLAGVVAAALGTYAQSSAVGAIEISAGLVPPDVKEDGSGREADIIREALRRGDENNVLGNKQLRFHVQPFGKHWYSYQTDDRYDAVATVPNTVSLLGYRSAFYITYRNGVGVIAESSLQPIAKLQDLSGKRVVSFTGAKKTLDGLGEQVRHFKTYIEREDQRVHSWMLLNGLVDDVIADAMVFSHFNQRIFEEERRSVSIQFYATPFKPTCYTMMFRKAEYRDLFDKGLKKMIGDGTLYEIDQRYLTGEIRNWDVQYLKPGGEAPCQS